MSTTTADPNSTVPWQRLDEALANDWWLLALRGVLGAILGIVALLMPVATIVLAFRLRLQRNPRPSVGAARPAT